MNRKQVLNSRRFFSGAICLIVTILVNRPILAIQVYWTDFESVKKADVEGGPVLTIVDMNQAFGDDSYSNGGIAVYGDSVFWMEMRNDSILRADLDGTNPVILANVPLGLNVGAMATDGLKLYWADDAGDAIWHSNIDGSDASPLINLTAVFGLQSYAPYGLSIQGDSIFWTDWIQDTINTAKLDGTDANVVVDLSTALPEHPICCLVVQGIATNDDSIFWTDGYRDSIYRANLDGTSITKLIDLKEEFGTDGSGDVGEYVPRSIELFGSSLYWVDSGTDAIYRSHLDGTNAELLLTDIGNNVQFIAVVPEPNTISVLVIAFALSGSLSSFGIRIVARRHRIKVWS